MTLVLSQSDWIPQLQLLIQSVLRGGVSNAGTPLCLSSGFCLQTLALPSAVSTGHAVWGCVAQILMLHHDHILPHTFPSVSGVLALRNNRRGQRIASVVAFSSLRSPTPSLELCLWVVVLSSVGRFRQHVCVEPLPSFSPYPASICLILLAMAVKGDCGNLGFTPL